MVMNVEPHSHNHENSYRVMNDPVRWNAAEYSQMAKGFWWYLFFSLVVVLMVIFDIFYLKSPFGTFSILIIVMALALVVYAKRPPKDLPYTLSADQGLYIAEKLYHFKEFKSFGVIHEGEKMYVGLIPIKRFSPMISIYFPQELGEEIVDVLGSKLPMQELKLDLLDRLIRSLRI